MIGHGLSFVTLCNFKMLYYLCGLAEDLEAVLNRSKSLLSSLGGGNTEDHLGIQLPRGGQAPGLGDLLVNQGAVVLEVGAEALGLKSEPD
jgi:hypothetical protein